MEPERNEVYERIPWETLDQNKGDRQWLLFGVAGAVVLGALAYSFMSNRPLAQPVETSVTLAQGTVPVASVPIPAVSPTPSTSPVVTAEADLYAVHPERVIDGAVAHAEWFVVEYLTVDGSEQGRETLTALMPAGIPLPSAPTGARVFVEWVRASSVVETGPLTYRVTVLARYLAAQGEGPYERQAPLAVTVEVSMTGEAPRVVTAPEVREATVGASHQSALVPVPEEIGSIALAQGGGTEIVGGTQTSDGEWRVVLLAVGPDGVSRPVTVSVP